ncbi:hypothetical protein [Halomonas colorata]|uniref:hypothetical protein n=1 Tax=Halomonas colorata TaxID=2742615 RepID=UPI001865DA62|nr:hypothetical protein [Halomonas colorata]
MNKEAVQLKAYHVQEDCEGTCVIVFDTNSASARRRGAGELNVEWESVQFCRRAPWADQYAAASRIPHQAMLNEGWWLSCGCCGQRISEDVIEDPESDCLPVIVGDWIYYNAQHHNDEMAEQKRRHEQELAALADARAKFPGAEVSHYHRDGFGRDAVCVLAPGTEKPARWAIGADTVSASECDKEAWVAYVASIKEASQ